MVIVYGLSSSEDGKIRYIGQTKKLPDVRLKAHIKEAIHKKNKLTHKHKWIRKVLAEGFQIQIVVLKENAKRNADEILFIRQYKELGADLVNATNGGDNAFELSPDARKKMSDRRKGKKLPPDTIAKLIIARRGRKLSEETKKKISKSLIGKRLSEETKKKISFTLRGRKVSEEHRLRAKQGVQQWWDSRK